MFQDVSEFYSASQPCIQRFNEWVSRYHPPAAADHICYKCRNENEYNAIRSLFEHQSTFIYQSIISGRRIAVIKFPKPLQSALGDIWFLELSDQKPDGSQTSGFDHIELYPTRGTVEKLAASLTSSGFALEKIVRPHHTTYDGFIHDTFKVRLESEPLVETIKSREMR